MTDTIAWANRPSKPTDRLWRSLNNLSIRTCRGFVAEAAVFRALSKLRTSAVRVVRSIENSGVDGVMVMPDSNIQPLAADISILDGVEWAKQNVGQTSFLEFDVKFVGSTVGSRALNQAQFYICVFPGVTEYVAVIPEAAIQVALGGDDEDFEKIARVARNPRRFSLFMVHLDDIENMAEGCFLAAKDGVDYQNPTTGAFYRGWRPRLSKNPRIEPKAASAHESGHRIITDIVDAMDAEKIKWCVLDMHEEAPLIADYSLKFDDLETEVLIESKARDGHLAFFAGDPSDPRSPAHPSRQYHFLVAKGRYTHKYQVIPCHQVSRIYSRDRDPKVEYFFDMPRDIVKMLKTIRDLAPEAIADAAKRLGSATIGTHSVDLRALVSMRTLDDPDYLESIEKAMAGEDNSDDSSFSDVDDSNLSNTTGKYDPKKEANVVFRELYEWMISSLNRDCCNNRKMVVLPLDRHHPYGNTTVVKHDWSDEDCKIFRNHGNLPFDTYHQGTQDRDCLIIDFWDLEIRDVETMKRFYPLWVARKHWRKPATTVERLIVGPAFSTFKGISSFSGLRAGLPWLVMPSSFTNLLRNGVEPMAQQYTNGHQGKGLVRRYKLITDVTVDKSVGEVPETMAPRGFFMSEQDADPRRHLLQFGDIFRHLYTLLYGGETMRIDNTQGIQLNPEFDTKPFRVKLRDVHQSLWDHGGRVFYIEL